MAVGVVLRRVRWGGKVEIVSGGRGGRGATGGEGEPVRGMLSELMVGVPDWGWGGNSE